jgi:hypothetical protein
MKVKIERETKTEKSTIGKLYINGVEKCYTLEDKERPEGEKIYGETAIPKGVYKLSLRTSGSTLNDYYKTHYADIHKGMIEIQNILEYKNVYIHIGNYPKDTLGCPLVGMQKGEDAIHGSTEAYYKIYPIIATAILSGEDVEIEVL